MAAITHSPDSPLLTPDATRPPASRLAGGLWRALLIRVQQRRTALKTKWAAVELNRDNDGEGA